jgi:cyclopropane-fatty-acyl-phospholipid synthase
VTRAEAIAGVIARNSRQVQVKVFDGSRAGAPDAPVTIDFRSPRAFSYLATSPNQLGLARAYVAGDIDVSGDIYTALSTLAGDKFRVPPGEAVRLLREMGGLRLLRRPPLPPQEVRLRGRLHSKKRDSEAISHHYDVSNKFYEYLLGPSMAYTCAVYPSPTATLEEAQFTKHDLVARKIGLRPGMRLLDVGCGWGGMVMHAAQHYGVKALGVTLSRRQAEWAQKAIAEAGLGGLAEVRHLDYRDVEEAEFDAISSIGLTEHIGVRQMPAYFSFLYRRLRPGGRLLNHCITEPDNTTPIASSGFIRRYIFPDGELTGPGRIISDMHDAGFEVRHEENLREHYGMTTHAWADNLEAHWEESVAEIGLAKARTWRLYLAGVRLAFEQNHIQLHQVLGVRVRDDGRSDMPLRPDWEQPA